MREESVVNTKSRSMKNPCCARTLEPFHLLFKIREKKSSCHKRIPQVQQETLMRTVSWLITTLLTLHASQVSLSRISFTLSQTDFITAASKSFTCSVSQSGASLNTNNIHYNPISYLMSRSFSIKIFKKLCLFFFTIVLKLHIPKTIYNFYGRSFYNSAHFSH